MEISEGENERIVRKFYEALNNHDADAAMTVFTDDVVYIGASGTKYDKKGLRKDCIETFKALASSVYGRVA